MLTTLATGGDSAAQTPPAWLTDGFKRREWVATPEQRSTSLVGDGVLDLRVAERDGDPWLDLLQPGTMEPRTAIVPASGGELTAFEQLRDASPAEFDRWLFKFGPGGLPSPARVSTPLTVGTVLVVRTLRPAAGGGGALAWLACREILPESGPATEPGGPPRVRLTLKFDLSVLPLDPSLTRVPRLDDGYYEQRLGARDGIERLFAEVKFRHPAAGGFDVLRLDRDHLEWSGGEPRGLQLQDSALLVIPAGSGVRGRAQFTKEFQLAGGAGERDRFRAATGSRLLLRAADVGFDRLLAVEVIQASKEGVAEFRWRDLKADDLSPPTAVGCDVTVLDEEGEPIRGAWVFARDGGAGGEVPESSPPPSATPPSLFTVQSDHDGKARVPVRLGVDATAVHLVAFTTGGAPRFGTRRGAKPSEGGGAECVIVLDRAAATPVQLDPPPGRATFVGLLLDGAATLIRVEADGRLLLPALERPALLKLARPYLRADHELKLAPDLPVVIQGVPADGLERRVRLISARDGTEVPYFVLEDVTPAGVLVAEAHAVVAPAELHGVEVMARVVAAGFAPVDLHLAADAPRDQELALTPLARKAGGRDP